MAWIRHKALDCGPGCVVEATLQLIDGKWKGVVLFHLFESSKQRNPAPTAQCHPAHADQSVARAGVLDTTYFFAASIVRAKGSSIIS
jgi:hypothetical protein